MFIYLSSEEFVSTFGSGEAVNLVASAFTSTTSEHVSRMIKVLQSEASCVVAWAKAIAQNQAINANAFVPVLVEGILSGKIDERQISNMMRMRLKFVNLTGVPGSQSGFHTLYRLEPSGAMAVPMNMMKGRLTKINDKLAGDTIDKGISCPNLGFALVIINENMNNDPNVQLADLLRRLRADDFRDANESRDAVIIAAREKLNECIEKAFRISQSPDAVGIQLLVAPLQRHLPADLRREVAKVAEDISDSPGVSKMAVKKLSDHLGIATSPGSLMKQLPDDLLEVFDDEFSVMELKDSPVAKPLKDFLGKSLRIGNSGKVELKRLRFDLRTGTVSLRIVSRAEHVWNGVGEIPRELRRFFSTFPL